MVWFLNWLSMRSGTDAELLPASLVAVIVYVPSKSLLRSVSVRFNRLPLNMPVRLEKVAVTESVGMVMFIPCTLSKLQFMFCVLTAGEASKMTKDTVTCKNSRPTTLCWTCLTVGGTEEEREGREWVSTFMVVTISPSRAIALLFHCRIKVYEQPSPSLQGQHHCGVWYDAFGGSTVPLVQYLV